MAVLIFGIGGGVSFYEGLVHWRRPVAIENTGWNYAVLAAALVFESISFTLAWRQFRRDSHGRPVWAACRGSKDPSTFTVLAEDSAALIGLAIAAAGVAASHELGRPRWDGMSMAIGLLLAGVAVLLIHQSRTLLVGTGVRPETAREVRAMALAHQEIERVGAPRSMYIGKDAVLLTLDVQFRRATPAERVAATIARLEADVRARYPVIRHMVVQATGPGEG